MPIHHMKQSSYTLKMYQMDVGCSLKGFCSLNHSEVVLFIIFALTLSPTFSANFPKPRNSCDGGNGLSLHLMPIHHRIKSSNTLNLYEIYVWDAV